MKEKGRDNETSKDAKHQTKYIHDLIIHEMLREKERQGNTTERQSNTTQLAQGSYFSKKKLPRVGLEPTTIRLLGVALTNLASYPGVRWEGKKERLVTTVCACV